MGKIVAPKYYVAAFYRKPNGAIAKMDLDWKGRPSESKLEEKRKKLNESFLPGGINAHVSDSNSGIIYIFRMEIRENRPSGAVVCTAKAPMFEVV